MSATYSWTVNGEEARSNDSIGYTFSAAGDYTIVVTVKLFDDRTQCAEATTTMKVRITGSCTYTQGYWKTHPEAWPVDSLFLGNRFYNKNELLSIL